MSASARYGIESMNYSRRIPVLGLLLLCALALLGVSACSFEERPAAPEIITNFSDSRPFSGEADFKATINFPIGNIIVEAAPENVLYSLDVDYDSSRFQPEASYQDGRLGFRLSGDRSTIHLDPGRLQLKIGHGFKSELKNRLILRISPKTRLDLTLHAGLGETRINLARLSTRRLDLESGVSSTFIACDTPNPGTCERLHMKAGVGELEALQLGNLNFETMDFEGGIGSSSLDFAGQWRRNASIKVKMGIGELQVRLPREVAAEVNSEKKFLSGLHLESFQQRGSTYFSDNFDSALIRLLFELHTGIGSVSVKWL
jgi:hypothetical protein